MVLGQNEGHKKSTTSFVLRGNKEFLERQKNVFDQLTTTKCNLRPEKAMDVEPNTPKSSGRVVTKQFRGKESIFKVPQDPVNYMRTIPDFKKNPHKWTKYSLADVKDEDMSDSSNTKTALSFLNELKSRSVEDMRDADEEPKKIVFKKFTPETGSSKLEVKASFRSSKRVMPEYVVGEKINKRKKNHNSGSSEGPQLKLDHLFEDE
ncbi:hypothetical protein Zmor_006179 [Zophobas morio]|uniref:U5 small nuclear ribonucleoprotein TSSC4 n=1 Tax=Zophobas morio TaxID=2755281 RepID=A0AA38ITB8_9CUCU|nr:hypothetical protein Zmor_006179 [Zophobas morio]